MRHMTCAIGLILAIACVAVLAAAAGNQAQPDKMPVVNREQLLKYFEPREYTDKAGKTMVYRVLKPWRHKRSRRYPLVLFLHGAGAVGDDNLKQMSTACMFWAAPENQVKYPCLVVAPQCPADETWGTKVHKGQTDAESRYTLDRAIEIIEALQKEFRIDADRIYVTGISMGGGGTWLIVARRPEMFAAAVPLCRGRPSIAPSIAKVPIWAFHGDADELVPVERTRSMIEALKAAGSDPRYSELSGVGHNCWKEAYGTPELLPWLFDQERGRKPKRRR